MSLITNMGCNFVSTTNSIGKIVSGSKVNIIGNNTKVYDVGEIRKGMARLYLNNKYTITIPIINLKAL